MTSDFTPEHSSKRNAESADETIPHLDEESLAIRTNAHKTLATLERTMDPELRKSVDALLSVKNNPSVYLVKFVEYIKNPSPQYKEILQESRMFNDAGHPKFEKVLAPVEEYIRSHQSECEQILKQILRYIDAKFLSREIPTDKKKAA